MTNLTLEQCKKAIDRSFDIFHNKPVIQIDIKNNRLIVGDRWSVKPQGKGWILICKNAVPDEVRKFKQIHQPDDNPEFTYNPVWKAAKPISIIIHTLMVQWLDIQSLEMIFETTGEKVFHDMSS